MTPEWTLIVATTRCPVCHANPGERCMTGNQVTVNHQARVELYRAVEMEIQKTKPSPDAHLGVVNSE